MLSTISKTKPKPSYEFDAIGTLWRIDASLTPALKRRIDDTIEWFDQAYSRFRPDSMVSQMAKKAGHYLLPQDTAKLVALYAAFYSITDGKMTPLIAGLLEDVGYDASYSLQPKAVLRDVEQWSEYLLYEDNEELIVKKPVLLDVGAIGKGYLVDLIAGLLTDAGVRTFTIDAGGDIMRKGTAISVGLEHPDHRDEAVGVVSLRNASLCGSAGNRRAWGSFHHIIDPVLKTSPTHIKAVWVVADSTAVADGLTTALYFVPASVLAQEFSFEYAIVYADDSFEASSDFPARFFTGETA